jgi:hypothetical protein
MRYRGIVRAGAMSAILLANLTTLAVAAPDRCRVMDPTGTPLNVRTAPNGRIAGNLPNGLLVSVIDSSSDQNGKAWVYIAKYSNGQPIGWVFREFLSCF